MTAAIVVLSPVGSTGQQFFDNNGAVLSGGKLYFYDAGSSTPHDTYTDSTGLVKNSNPIVLDSAGRISGGGGVWLVSAHAYKIVLTNSTGGTTFGTWDNITLLYGATTTQVASITANTAAIAVINAAKSGFRAYRSSALAITGATTIIFNTKVYDTLVEYNAATGIWTPTVAGKYLITAGVSLVTAQADGANIRLDIYNGAALARTFNFFGQGSAAAPFVSRGDIFNVTVGDTYSVKVSGQSAASDVYASDTGTWFAAQYLGP